MAKLEVKLRKQSRGSATHVNQVQERGAGASGGKGGDTAEGKGKRLNKTTNLKLTQQDRSRSVAHKIVK